MIIGAKRCPPGVVTACHNSEDSTTISGPLEVTRKFVAELKGKKKKNFKINVYFLIQKLFYFS